MTDVDMKSEVEAFLKEYERTTNTHDFNNVRPLIAEDAMYFFSEQTLNGIDEIEKAFVETWDRIKEETYSITDISWVVLDDGVAVCTYTFDWEGMVEGTRKSGSGRGTNVLVKNDGTWQMTHEHLSTI
jgi:uncharacterized protein (TIGR02246 family)